MIKKIETLPMDLYMDIEEKIRPRVLKFFIRLFWVPFFFFVAMPWFVLIGMPVIMIKFLLGED